MDIRYFFAIPYKLSPCLTLWTVCAALETSGVMVHRKRKQNNTDIPFLITPLEIIIISTLSE
jgi:hypothetical protein